MFVLYGYRVGMAHPTAQCLRDSHPTTAINITGVIVSEKSKTIIIGLDGVPFDMLKGFAGDGTMPNAAKLIAGGTLKKMRSSIPDISSVAWSSIITGVNPARPAWNCSSTERS